MIKAADIFQDNMILQREKPVKIWGRSDPGAAVTVNIQGKCAVAEADDDGAWSVTLPPLAASESETLILTAGDETLTLRNIAVGEVWLAGGQSNMEFWMRYEAHRRREGALCPNRRLRFYDVPKVCYNNQVNEFDYSRMGIWRTATRDDLDYFSAVGYYFQKELSKDMDIPVGIIGCNWGGTVSAAWMDADTVAATSRPWMEWFASVPEYQDMEAYIEARHGQPVNDHGNPFGDIFLETVLPRTLEYREAGKFLINLIRDPKSIYEEYEHHPQPQSIPGSLFTHMVRPLADFAIRGVLWYQGEGDDEFGLAGEYASMLTALISDWRGLWGDPELPFLIVQIPGFSHWLIDFPGNDFMTIRRCQEQVCDTVPNAWLCSASDAGAECDAHPKDKEPLGRRLALLAEGHIYGEGILCDPPRLSGVARDDDRLILMFSNTGEGLYISGDALTALTISDGERELSYEAAVDGDRLILNIKDCPGCPLTVSFAQTSWYCVNLYNSAGIPAIPFTWTSSTAS